jgi:hypothetical protein
MIEVDLQSPPIERENVFIVNMALHSQPADRGEKSQRRDPQLNNKQQGGNVQRAGTEEEGHRRSRPHY